MTLRAGVYRHFKGNEYLVQGVAKHSDSGESLLVYTPLYGEGGLWVRPLSMFEEHVERQGKTQARFTYIRPNVVATTEPNNDQNTETGNR